jgi:DNA-binding response OmpR family regulator
MIKIMIVDDDPHVTALLKKYLSPKKTEVILVNDSSNAMHTAKTRNPDLFIIDLMMPPPDGFELCRMLRAEPRFAQTPILIITAMEISNSKATAFGANDYLAKPFDLDEIVDKINHLLNGDTE